MYIKLCSPKIRATLRRNGILSLIIESELYISNVWGSLMSTTHFKAVTSLIFWMSVLIILDYSTKMTYLLWGWAFQMSFTERLLIFVEQINWCLAKLFFENCSRLKVENSVKHALKLYLSNKNTDRCGHLAFIRLLRKQCFPELRGCALQFRISIMT